jgi:arachidonate 15-lipoxygenase
MLRWFVRRGIWDFIAWGKFFVSKPLNIPLPPNNQRRITPKPMFEAIHWLPLRKVMVCSRADVPCDERNWVHTVFYDFQVWFYKVISPMQPGLPRIDADPERALKHAFNGLRRTLFQPPQRPAEYLGSPDLGSLAVRGPFACYTTRSKTHAAWEWDLTMLNNYEHHPGLVKIGSRVLFRKDLRRRSLQAYQIDCALGSITPADARWDQACKIALCAASTHLSLVRHFNWVHLAGGAQLAIATRNTLSRDHPLCRLLWPYIYGTQQSNDMVTRGQMARGGDFETTFSLTFDEMCRLFDDTYVDYRHVVNDPETDGDSRGVRGAGFDTPTQQNLEALFCVMHCFVGRYLEIYYPRSAVGAKAVQRDPETLAWLKELNTLLPNGVGVDPNNFTWDELARMLAGQLYLVTVQHEILGSFMWNYQLWTHCQPARIYTDFQPEPLDVYQRLVNSNYNLNVRRRALMHNFSQFGLDPRAQAAILQFHADLAALQTQMDSHPHTVWRVYPRELKVNINA